MVGISLGGTSKQGLQLARDVCDELLVFHEPGRTFHPKVYLATGEWRARALVGSNNLTYGGLSRNYEAAVLSDLDLGSAAEKLYFDTVKGFMDGLVSEDELCHEVTADFLTKLMANERYPLLDEDAGRDTDEDPIEGGGSTGRSEPESEVLFGAAKRPKRPARRPPNRGPGGSSGSAGVASSARRPRTRGAATRDPAIKRWYKPLERADAQQLGGNSNPSNTITLVDGGHPIDRNTYFRYVFFAVNRGARRRHKAASLAKSR